MSITFGLSAENCSGNQYLHFQEGAGEGLNITLTGNYEGKDIQIDFDYLTPEEVNDLIFLLGRYKKERPSLNPPMNK